MDELKEIISLLTPIIIAIGVAWINYKGAKRSNKVSSEVKAMEASQDEKMEIRNNIILNRLQTVEIVINEIDNSLKKHLIDDDFRKGYRKSIKGISSDIIKNPMLNQVYKTILVYWSEEIEKFGLNYYYSDIRKEKERNRRKYLEQGKHVIVDEFTKYVNSTEYAIKLFRSERVQFADFLMKNNVFGGLDILIMDLAKNGLNDQQLIDKFEDYIDKFADLFVSSCIVWEGLDKSKQFEDTM